MSSATEPTTKQRIIAAAVALFAERGFDATSVNEVVARAAVAKGALYHHFASKDDLLYEVYRELIDRQVQGLERILEQRLTAAETLRALITDLVVTTAARAAEATVFFHEGHRLSDVNQERVRRARRTIHDAVIELVRAGQQNSEFSAIASPEIVTFTVFGLINGLPIWYQPGGGKTPAEIATELSDLILAGLRPERGQPPTAETRQPPTAETRPPSADEQRRDTR